MRLEISWATIHPIKGKPSRVRHVRSRDSRDVHRDTSQRRNVEIYYANIMRDALARYLVRAAVVAISIACASAPADAAPVQAYKLTSSLKVGGEGGWDYVTLNPEGALLYVTRTTP